MQITWLGHGSFQFRLSSGQTILMDPWVEGNPAYPKSYTIDRVDTICISHGHFDHIHDTPPLAQKFSPEVVAIFETCVWLESKGVKNTRAMNKGGSQKVGDVVVTMTHAVHSCGILDDGKIIYGGEAAGIRAPSARWAHGIFRGRYQRVHRHATDRAVVPSGTGVPADRRSVHNESAEAAAACRLLRAKKVIPMHFGTFPPLTGRPEQLQALIAGSGTEVWALEPGKTVDW